MFGLYISNGVLLDKVVLAFKGAMLLLAVLLPLS